MDFHELFNILQTSDETDRIEAKAAGHGIGKSFLETVSAFSNEPDLGGGYILLGITQNEGEPRYVVTGISDPDRLQNEIASQCRLSFNVLITPTIKVISHPQGIVLLVYIPEAGVHEKPVYIKSKGREEGSLSAHWLFGLHLYKRRFGFALSCAVKA